LISASDLSKKDNKNKLNFNNTFNKNNFKTKKDDMIDVIIHDNHTILNNGKNNDIINKKIK